MTPRTILLFTFACAPLAVIAAAGCTVDANIGSGGDRLAEGGRDALASDAPSGNDAGRDDAPADASSADAEPPVDAGCGVAYAQEGGWVNLEVRQQVTPSGNGGTLVPGRYALIAYRSYLNGPQGTGEARETLELTGSPSVGAYTRLSEVRNATGEVEAHGPRGERFTFTTESTIFMRKQATCPPQASSNFADRFSATPTSLTLIDGEDETERVYQRIP